MISAFRFRTTIFTASVAASWLITTCSAEPITLKVVKVDSEETSGEDGKGANAVDGDPATFWHTQWQDASPGHPHEIVIELSRMVSIKGFTYLPRQDESDHGCIKDYEFYASEDGKDFGDPLKKGSLSTGKDKQTVSFEATSCRFIKLRALSEVNGEVWTSAAEIGVVPADSPTPPVPKLRVVKVDSEETSGEDGKGANAVDGDPATFWHTQWQNATPECPHEIIIALEPPSKIQGLTYLPRQDDIDHGYIKEYEIYLSEDGKEFGDPVKKGTFENNKEKKTANFASRTCRFIKLKALSEINGEAWTSAAEIGVIVAE